MNTFEAGIYLFLFFANYTAHENTHGHFRSEIFIDEGKREFVKRFINY